MSTGHPPSRLAWAWLVSPSSRPHCCGTGGRTHWAGSSRSGVLALGLVTAAMYVIGVIFGGLWVMAIVLGRRVELVKAARQATDGR